MGKTKTIDNLKNIFIQSHRWRNSDLSDKQSDKKFNFFSNLNIIIFILATGIVLTGKNIDDVALNSILTFASVFATLIIPVIILVFDKFANNPNKYLDEVQQQSTGAKERAILYKNFTSRFIFTALENVFIAIVIISIIIAYKAFLTGHIDINPFDYTFQKAIDLDGILVASKIILVLFGKVIFVLLLMKFILFIFYSISALGDFFQDGLKNRL